jgi:hypothetical protein
VELAERAPILSPLVKKQRRYTVPDFGGLSRPSWIIRNHITNIFSKPQVVDRAQAIVRARDAGLGVT